MSNYTNNLSLENPIPGDPAVKNAWGTIENTGRTKTDTAFGSVLSLSVAGAANVVLTFNNGSADQNSNAHFIFTGILTGNIVVLFGQNSARSVTCKNSTTGAFTLAVGNNNGSSVPAGTTVTIPQGSSMGISLDGTNAVERQTFVSFASTPTASQTTVRANIGAASQAGTENYAATDTGSAGHIICSLTPDPGSYTAGLFLTVIAAHANTTTCDINVNGHGVKNIFKPGAAGPVALTGGEIQVGQAIDLIYDGTQFEMQSPPAGVISSLGDATNGGIAVTGTPAALKVGMNAHDLVVKATPITADSVVITDSAASDVTKQATISSVLALSTITKVFTSSGQAITAAGTLTVPHTLGVSPLIVQGFLHCVTNDLGYTAGQEVPIALGGTIINGGSSVGVSLTYDASNFHVFYGGGGQVFVLINAGTGTVNSITPANWTFVIRAYA